jgi:dipeptidase E
VDARKLILAGGGDADVSAPLDRIFAEWTGGGRMLYLPIAMETGAYSACERWIRSVFEPLGVKDIEMWTDLSGRSEPSALDRFASVYIGGGNTFRLLHLVRESGFDEALVQFVRRGGPVYGGSAGAILLGRETSTAAHADANYLGLTDLRGLDLVGGASVWCHHSSAERAALAQWRAAHDEPLIAIAEASGYVVEGDRARVVGTEPVECVSRDGRRVALRPGDVMTVGTTPVPPAGT